MNLVEWLKELMTSFGASWVMWLLIALSVVSVAIMLERGWFYWQLRDDIGRLAERLRQALRRGELDEAGKLMEASPSAEAAVVVAGLAEAPNGAEAASEAMEGASALQRMRLERRLTFLATLGNNAPFVGLFGTVIGIVQAFDALATQETLKAATSGAGGTPAEVMAAISEALVATAVGIGVAIPAVAANNYFQRVAKSVLANTNALSRVLLAHLKAETPEERGT